MSKIMYIGNLFPAKIIHRVTSVRENFWLEIHLFHLCLIYLITIKYFQKYSQNKPIPKHTHSLILAHYWLTSYLLFSNDFQLLLLHSIVPIFLLLASFSAEPSLRTLCKLAVIQYRLDQTLLPRVLK